MVDTARAWLAVAGGAAVAVAGILGLSGARAGAEPTAPIVPALPTSTQTVAATPAVGPSAPMAVVAPAPQAGQVPGQPSALAGNPSALAGNPSALARTPANQAVPSPPGPTLVPATSGTLRDFLKSKGVKLEPQQAQGFKALNITLPMPSGWSQVPDPNVPDAFLVIANRNSPDLYTPNAQLVVYKLIGDFDPKDAIAHGFVDTQMLPAWQATGASLTDFYGLPSSIIEGSYRSNDMTLNTSRRYVIAQSGPDRYLVSLSVTTMATNQGVSAAAAAADAIVNGFRVAPPTP